MLRKTCAAAAWLFLASMPTSATCERQHGSAASSPLHRQGDFAASIPPGTTLKVMPLGASITYGYLSTDGNGYRSTLRDLIVQEGGVDTSQVDLVGGLQGGNMADNDNEGFIGFRIEQVVEKAQADVPTYKPNAILINLGTNDAAQSFELDTVKDRMAGLLDLLWANMDPGPIVLSTLLVNGNSVTNNNAITINEMYRALVNEQRAAGKPIVLVETYDVPGLGTDQLVDGTHPTDAGYRRLGELFWGGMKDAADQGFFGAVAAPAPAALAPTSTPTTVT